MEMLGYSDLTCSYVICFFDFLIYASFDVICLFIFFTGEKFNDGTDKIELGGFRPTNMIRGQHILFLASFHNNDTTLSQLHALIVLLGKTTNSSSPLPFFLE
jgi:hypothetical protein